MTDHETARHIALVAHDNCKAELVRWVRTHARELKDHRLTCTGTTGRLVREALPGSGLNCSSPARLEGICSSGRALRKIGSIC